MKSETDIDMQNMCLDELPVQNGIVPAIFKPSAK